MPTWKTTSAYSGVKINYNASNQPPNKVNMENQANMQLRNSWKWEFSSDQSQTFIFWVTVNKSWWSFRNLQLSQDVSLITSKIHKDTARWAHNPSLISLPFCNLLIYPDFHSERESSLKITFWKGQKQFSNFFKCF